MFKFIHLCSEGQALICVKLTIKMISKLYMFPKEII